MQTVHPAQDISIFVLFETGVDSTAVPDTDSVAYTLYANDGTMQTTGTVSTGPSDTQTTITFDGSNTIKDSGKLFEMRTLEVRWTVDDAFFTKTIPFRIQDYIPYTVDFNSVRSLLGLARNELPDTDIDIFAAYVDLSDEFGSAALTTALTSGGKSSIAANRAIAAQCLINVLGSIEIRTLQQDKSNTAQQSRFAKIDFDVVRAWLQKLVDDAEAIIVGVADSSYSGVTLITTLPTIDPMTGIAPVIPGS